jgi:FkbM family methyltransferase
MWLRAWLELRKSDFVVCFVAEGKVCLRMPHISSFDAVVGRRGSVTTRCAQFLSRPNKEILLRRMVYHMYQSGVLDADKCIVDIGAWIGDNALPWAKMLSGFGTGRVLAIDPAPENIAFAREVARLNDVVNVSWCCEVCADTDGRQLWFSGPIDHVSFDSQGDGRYCRTARTIDSVIGKSLWSSIGLLHLDVEGLEAEVLAGARHTMTASRPIVLAEHHLSDGLRAAPLLQDLTQRQYRVFIVNECLPGCRADCRNLLAVPSERSGEVCAALTAPGVLSMMDVLVAAPGPSLVPLSPYE